MAQVALSIVAPSGAELPLASSPWDAGTHRVMDGTAGLGAPPVQAAFTESSGEGRRLGGVRASGRTITLAIGIFGRSRPEVETAIDTLADHLAYVDGMPLPRLRATYQDGSARELEVIHTNGTEGLTAYGETVSRQVLTLEAEAYWTDSQYAEFIVSQTDDGKGFLESLPNVYLQPSDAFGDVRITNPGKVPSFVEWELRGPLTRASVTKNGEGWSFEDPLAEGEVVTIRKTPAGIEVRDATGASRYTSLNDVPRFFYLEPGVSRLAVEVTGTSPASRVIGRYRPRYRQVF